VVALEEDIVAETKKLIVGFRFFLEKRSKMSTFLPKLQNPTDLAAVQ
jgi:hypothetical protein